MIVDTAWQTHRIDSIIKDPNIPEFTARLSVWDFKMASPFLPRSLWIVSKTSPPSVAIPSSYGHPCGSPRSGRMETQQQTKRREMTSCEFRVVTETRKGVSSILLLSTRQRAFRHTRKICITHHSITCNWRLCANKPLKWTALFQTGKHKRKFTQRMPHRDTLCNLMNATTQTCSRQSICVCNHVSILVFYRSGNSPHHKYWGFQSSNQKIRHVGQSIWTVAQQPTGQHCQCKVLRFEWSSSVDTLREDSNMRNICVDNMNTQTH